jgi:PAS domain S-box-containing protein
MTEESKISRIIKITEALRESAENNFSLRIATSEKNDEIDKLADAMNQILEKRNEENRGKTDTKPEHTSSISERNILQSLIDSLEYGLTIQDRNYNIIFQNEYLIKVYGYSRGKCYNSYEFRENICEGCPVKMSFEDNMSHTTERPVLMPSGETIIWENTATPIKDADGNISACLEVVRDITDRVKSVELLRVREKQMSDIISASPVGMAIYDGTGQCIIANDSMAKIIGTSKEQMLTYNYNNIGLWKKSGFLESVRKAIDTQSLIRQEIRDISSFGKNIFIDCQIVPFEKNSVLIMFHDIEEQKRTEAALKDSEIKYRTVVESSLVGVYIIQDGIFKFVNNRWYDMYGYTREEIIDKLGPVELTPLEGRSKVEENLRRRFSGEINKIEYITKGIRKDGKIIDIRVFGSIMEYNGRPAVSGTVIDITEQTRAMEALRESEVKMRSIVNNIGIGVALISPDMKVLEVNQRMHEWFPGIYLEQHPLCYKVFSEPPLETVCDICPVQKTLQDGLVHEAITPNLRGNKVHTYRLATSPVFNNKNEISAVIELTEDITERISLEAQLRQSQKMEAIGRLAGGVAHDFNNMLSVILGYSEMALDEIDPSQPIHHYLKEIHNASIRSAEIVRQLLAFARKQTFAPKVLNLNNTVENMLRILQRMIGEDINIALMTHPDVWPVKMDPVQIEQILANLCVNARDAITGIGKITIETGNVVFDEYYCRTHPGFAAGEYSMLAVSDNGCGIEKNTIDKIFEPFFSTKGIGKGTGLGLATVFGIVKQNNGFINVYSELDKGTTFKIYFPRHIGQADENPIKTITDLPVSRGEMILVVEDEPMILKITSIMLETQKYKVLTASTPGEAIRLAEEYTGEINLLMTDVILPEMNGKDLAKQIKEKRPGMKCIYMSGYTANVIAHRGMLDDGVNFIQKPFSIQTLIFKIREVLDKE